MSLMAADYARSPMKLKMRADAASFCCGSCSESLEQWIAQLWKDRKQKLPGARDIKIASSLNAHMRLLSTKMPKAPPFGRLRALVSGTGCRRRPRVKPGGTCRQCRLLKTIDP